MLGLLFAAVFIALNGFFVAAEFALVKVSATLAHTKKQPREDPRIGRAREVVSRIDRYLSVTQFGITLASLGLGWIGEPAIETLVDNAARSVLGHEPGRAVHVGIVAVAFGILTFSHVLFGELVPKLVAIQRSDEVAYGSARFLQLIYIAFQPLLWILERATRLILRAMGMSADAASEGTLSEDELIGILAASAARSPGGKSRAELFERVVHFAQRTARHAMVPRVDVFTLPIGTTGEEAVRELRTHQYSRVLLTKEKSVDEVAGYLYAKDFLLDPANAQLPSLDSVRREIIFVPETQGLLDVLRQMQQSQIPIAVVVDEYGGTSGIVTMEDLLEEIVGEIRDELDVEAARIAKVPNDEHAWDVDARATLEELRSIGVHTDEEEWAETVGTAVLERLGRIPRIGDKVDLGPDATVEITSVSRRRIMRVRVRVKPAPLSTDQ
ncbi:Magnesium and cobalt efflux protein CorC [Labilithrix luteola]|uniref:Magnesium and cobalt efflux protein CorC n=1 Tax=Labilithrix luteola TaxID=1391654 RepID=A0A0K1PR89_9BACT|nr:hemolysin family protein [Labilithrix luteola]AKU95891.1 Magnesium and cobalt efflux protein CorC [Labilithrix luteola]